jgi:hypothetical protein
MLTQSTAKQIAMIGYALAVAGIVLYSQLDRIVDLKMSENVLGVIVLTSVAATFGGFLTAIVGSAIWARRSPTRQPLKVAVSIGLLSFLLCLAVRVNIHGSSALLMFLVPFSVVNVLSVLIASGY